MTRDPFARWMALAFPWIEQDAPEWKRLKPAWEAGRDGQEYPRTDPGTRAAWQAGKDSAT